MTESTLNLLKDCTILLVEDDEIAAIFIKNGLKPYCKQFFSANDGLGGLDMFKNEKIDVIITDIHLPNLNGFDMINEILNLKPSQKFIIITSYDTDVNLLKSIKNGAFAFLRKPIKLEELQTNVLMLNSKDSQKIIQISQSISVNLNTQTIYKNGNALFLTKTLDRIFWLLCYNLDRMVSYDMIEEFAYGKETSRVSMQNAILKLKKQLEIDIKNIAETGYVLRKT